MTTKAFRAVAVRSGEWWEIEVTSGPPDNVLGVSQTRNLAEVDDVASHLIADLLEVSADDIEVEVEIPQPGDIPA